MKSLQTAKLLILSGELGDGHKQAANALAEAASASFPNISTVTIDFMELVYPKMHRAAKYLYIQGVKKFPSVYGYLYRKTRYSHSTAILKRLRLLGLGRLLGLLADERPDAVVCTFPVAAAAMSLVKSSGLSNVPHYTVITDHTDHSYWIHPQTDTYIVGSDQVKRGLMRLSIPEDRIAVTGIPVRQAFQERFNRIQLQRKYALVPNKQTIMVMGGGYGMITNDLFDLIRTYDPARCQWLIVCGHNTKLYNQLAQRMSYFDSHIRLFGYTDCVHELMAVSDLLITKPGGMTTSEAVSVGVPMLLYRPLPGQEQDNAAYCVDAGTALQANDEEDLSKKLHFLLNSPSRLSLMRLRAESIRVPDSGMHALQAIMERNWLIQSEHLPISAGATHWNLFYT